MKKTLTSAALSSVLVLGMASAAMAIHTEVPAQTYVAAAGAAQITIDGAIRMRGAIESNSAAQDSSDKAYYDGRVRLGVKAVVAPGAIGYVELETGAGSSDTYKWGGTTTAGSAGALHTGGMKNAGALNILQAWINYQPSNWGVKVGHMPLALGNKVFFDHTGSGDDAVVAYINPNDNTHVAGILIKFDENSGEAAFANTTDHSSDINGYVGLVTHKFSDSLNVGANWTYLDGGSPTAVIAQVEPAAGLSMSNIGVTVDGKATNALSYSADVEFQFGTFSEGVANAAGTSGGLGAGLASAGNTSKSVDAKGYAVRLAGTMDLGAAKVGLLYGYGSGDDGLKDDDQDAFINFLTDTEYDVLIGNYRQTIPGTFTTYSGLSNLSLYQVNGSTSFTCPMSGKDVDLRGSLSYMQLNEDLDRNTMSTTQLTAWGATARGDDNVGTEIDAVATWHLTPGLDYKIEAAYLFVDDVFNTAPTGNGNNPDDLVFLRHRLELKF